MVKEGKTESNRNSQPVAAKEKTTGKGCEAWNLPKKKKTFQALILLTSSHWDRMGVIWFYYDQVLYNAEQ